MSLLAFVLYFVLYYTTKISTVNCQTNFFSRIRNFKVMSIEPKIPCQYVVKSFSIAISQENLRETRKLNRTWEYVKNFCLRDYHLPIKLWWIQNMKQINKTIVPNFLQADKKLPKSFDLSARPETASMTNVEM